MNKVKMKWKWKRPAAVLLAAAMIFTMSGVPASAVEAGVSAASGNAAASTEKTISGDVNWNGERITTPVELGGDTTITLTGENSITITDTAYTAALDMYYHNLTIQGSGSLTVNVPKGKGGIEDGNWSNSAGGKLTIKDGVKITTKGGRNGLSAKTIVIENGNLNLNSGYGIDTASLTMNGGTLYATGKFGAISNSSYGNARNIKSNLTILYSENQNAKPDDMSVGTADDTKRDGEVKTIYIAKMGPRASLIVGAQQGTIQESLGRQTATFSVTGSNVKKETLQVEWVGDHTGLTAVKSSDGATITVTADSTVKAGSYKLKLTADSENGFSPAQATATATVTVAAAPRNPITIRTQPQVSDKKGDGQFKADVWVRAQLEGGTSGNITYQWYVNGKEFTGTGSGSNRITLTPSDLTTTAGKNWEYSGQVYCKLSYQSYTLDTNTVPVTFNTCPHEKYTHEGKCQQCGEPCSKDVLFIRNGIPYTFEGDNPDVGFILFSGGTAYFVRDTNATLKAGNGEPANKMDITLDLQGHKVKTLDLQNFPYKSVTIKNGTINDIATSAPAVLILDSVTTSAGTLDKLFTLTVKGNCVFQHQVNFLGKTQLQGGTFQGGINAALGEEALALLADGYAFVDADSNEILNVSNVDIANRAVKVVAHTDQYQNGKCACGRSCDHAGTVDSAGYCTRCHMLVEAFEIGGKRYTSLENALAAAQDGDTVTLRGPLTIENREPIEISKNITLNLNGHTLSKSAENGLLRILGSNVAIINGTVQHTNPSTPYHAVAVGKSNQTGAKLTLDNVTLEGSTDGKERGVGLGILTGNEAVVTSGKFIGGIYTEGALTMSGGSADLLELGALNGIPVTLSGGSFDSIKIKNGANYQSLLAEGYAYQKQGGALLKLSEMKENTAVTVVKCSHPDDSSGGNVCPYCGYAAEVTKTDGSTSYHRTADAAIAAADGGTVKLLANAGEITIGSPLKLNLNGKTATKLTVTGDVTLASLLPEGYTFKSGNTWISDLSGTELSNVSMAKITIKSMDYPTEMSMTYGGAGTLLVNVKKETGAGTVSFQWYKVEGGKETAVGSATTSNQFNLSAQNLPAGNHIFRFSATCDGYKKMSQDIAVTVQRADISANRIMPPTAQENLTYTGQEQALITAGSVTSGGTMQYSLTENGTYSQDIPAGTDAGAYTVWYRVIGDANHNDTTPASVAVRIGQKPLTITEVTAASKPYDGTTDADITSVTFEGGVTLQKDEDYTVTANFDDAGVDNGKNVTATVTLMGQAAKNYALEQSSFTTTGNITKAAAPDFIKETALDIVNGYEKTYTVTLPTLPTLKTPKEYGALTYEIGGITLDGGYYTGGAKVEDGKLILPIQKNDVKTTGSVGTVTVVIKSTNYEDITLTVCVDAVNKKVPVLAGELSFSKATLTYGEQLDNIKISGAMKDGNNGVTGSFAWQTPSEILAAGTHQATWTFKPTDTNTYAAATGTTAVTVDKATPTGTPIYEKITAEKQTLADAKLKATEEAAEGTTPKSRFTANGREVAGTISWLNDAGNALTEEELSKTQVVQGKAYAWRFTPTDTANYKTLSGTIVLWAKPSSGGGVVTPAPTPADADVVTIKGDNKDNTNAKPGAETGTTTTKTTVKNTTTATTKNEQGQEVSKTTASVSKDLGDKLLDQAVSNKSNMIEITVKSSDANNNGGTGASAADSVKATEVELPKATVNAIAKDTNADLVIKTDNGEVVLDNKTLETIAGAAKGDTVTIVVGENTQLKETQKPAEKIVGKNGTLFDLAAKIGEKLLHQFEGGKAHVTLPMPEKLKGKEVLVIYIDDNGLCKILNHSVEKIGAEDYIRFTTTHFSTFAVVDKDEAERPMKEQNAAHVKELMQSAKFKVTTTKTSKKSVKVQVAAKSSKTMISDIKSLGYTIKYQFYRSTKKTAGYKVIKTKAANTFTNTKSTKGTKYYYKARVLVYDGKTLVAKSELGQCSYGARTWTK